jgi:hypothetical protein
MKQRLDTQIKQPRKHGRLSSRTRKLKGGYVPAVLPDKFSDIKSNIGKPSPKKGFGRFNFSMPKSKTKQETQKNVRTKADISAIIDKINEEHDINKVIHFCTSIDNSSSYLSIITACKNKALSDDKYRTDYVELMHLCNILKEANHELPDKLKELESYEFTTSLNSYNIQLISDLKQKLGDLQKYYNKVFPPKPPTPIPT